MFQFDSSLCLDLLQTGHCPRQEQCNAAHSVSVRQEHGSSSSVNLPYDMLMHVCFYLSADSIFVLGRDEQCMFSLVHLSVSNIYTGIAGART